MMYEWFMEIFTEKLPSACQVDQYNNLMNIMNQMSYIDVVDLYTQSMSNRFIALLKFNKKQQSIKGPKTSAASDIVQRFADKQGVSVDKLSKMIYGKDECWSINNDIDDDVIHAALVDAALRIDWPEYMSYGVYSWPRPIRNVCSLLNWKHQKMYVAKLGMYTANESRISAYSSERFVVNDFAQYKKHLAKHGVYVDYDARCEAIREQVRQEYGDAELCEKQITRFARFSEAPVICFGQYDAVDMPQPLTELAIKQDYVLYFRDGVWICCLDGALAYIYDGTRPGLQRAISSRLKEIKLLFDRDKKLDLAWYKEELGQKEVFQNKLGSFYNKGCRIRDVVRNFGITLDNMELIELGLCMSISDEFDNISFLGSGLYFAHNNMKDLAELCLSIHGGMHEDMPMSQDAMVVAIVAAMDTIVTLFGVGIRVKGSSDPLAIRRLGNFLVKTNHVLRMNLREVGDLLRKEYDKQDIRLSDNVMQLFDDFIDKRIDWFLNEMSSKYYLIARDAKLAWHGDRLACEIDKNAEMFDEIGKMYKRACGICRNAVIDSSAMEIDYSGIAEHKALQARIEAFDCKVAMMRDVYDLLNAAMCVLDNVVLKDLDDDVHKAVMCDLRKCVSYVGRMYSLN